jgi:hypothetical protein
MVAGCWNYWSQQTWIRKIRYAAKMAGRQGSANRHALGQTK